MVYACKLKFILKFKTPEHGKDHEGLMFKEIGKPIKVGSKETHRGQKFVC